MPTPKRHHPSVIQRLLDEPSRFQFVQAVRVLESWLAQNGVARHRALADYLRFDNSVSMRFPASEIEALSPDAPERIGTDAALLAALLDESLRHIRITPAFMSLLGANGALPYHYSERIANQLHNEKNDCPRAFLDTYSSRALALYCQAWSKYRLECQRDDEGKDGFLPLLLALGGFRPRPAGDAAADPQSDEISDEALAYYAGVLRHRPVSAIVMARVLSEYFGVPFELEEFVGSWLEMTEENQTVLGGANAVVGRAIAGSRVWRRDLCVRIRIGPLDKKNYERFLPGGNGARALKKMLAAFAGAPLRYEVRPVLRARDVARLSTASGNGPWGRRAGFDAFVFSGASVADRDDLFYELAP